jgi:hypothetical protein
VKKTLTLVVVFCTLSLCAGSSRAGLIFFDDFNSYTAGIPWSGSGSQWTVSDGSVDLIGEGTSWDLQSGNGLYIDMDGSTHDAGKITSDPIDLAPGDYVLFFDVAGNQRTTGSDELLLELSGIFPTLGPVPIPGNLDFTTLTVPFSIACATTTSIIFECTGDDNKGWLLDNVGIATADNIIPAPGAILLGSIGVGIVGWLRRRRIV